MKTEENENMEVLIPKGYELDEIMDFGDEYEEEPIITEEVRIRIER